MDEEPSGAGKKAGKQYNTLPIWGNEASMNLNPLILANIQGSSYFKVHLFKLKTYHEVVDEIYYQVKHMEPWERGSRKTSGQTGMCGGVRGVGAGGIVSTAYCLLYKLYTLRLTRKQVNGLLNHADSPYIRALGFMYLRYTQPPGDLYSWYEDYLFDEEEIDVKAGGGQIITIGQMVYQFLTKLDWFSTLFPRIPVPIQKQIEKMLEHFCRENHVSLHQLSSGRGTNTSNANANVNAGIAVNSDLEATNYERRIGSSRDEYTSRALPPTGNYRNEHDDRDNHHSTSSHSSSQLRRRKEYSNSPPPENHLDTYCDKHKKKKKRKHHSRSRSRSRSHSRNSYDHQHHQHRRTHREHDRRHERCIRDKSRDNYSDKRNR